jgi:hypothetical protein
VPFPVLLSTLIRSHFQAKPATLLIPIDFPFLLAVEELYGTRYLSGSFSLINAGSGFHCLRSFSFFLLESTGGVISLRVYFLLRWSCLLSRNRDQNNCHVPMRANSHPSALITYNACVNG